MKSCPHCKGTNLSYYDFVACIDCNEVLLPEGLTFDQRWKIFHSKEYINSVPRCQEYGHHSGRPVKIRNYGPIWAICQKCSDNQDALLREEYKRSQEEERQRQLEDARYYEGNDYYE